MTLLICPVRPGNTNEELRYALRSWETNLREPSGLYLLTVGYRPSWLEPDEHIDGNRFGSVQANVFTNILLASEYAQRSVHENHIFMNDDFFCLDPVLSVPVTRRDITLAQHSRLYPNWQTMWFSRSLDLTASWLIEAGFPQPWSYDLHRPLPAPPGAMFEALSKWEGGYDGDVPQWRSLYGNYWNVDAIPVLDVKVGTKGATTHSPWLSTSDRTWPRVGRDIMRRFQKPSRWEKS